MFFFSHVVEVLLKINISFFLGKSFDICNWHSLMSAIILSRECAIDKSLAKKCILVILWFNIYLIS